MYVDMCADVSRYVEMFVHVERSGDVSGVHSSVESCSSVEMCRDVCRAVEICRVVWRCVKRCGDISGVCICVETSHLCVDVSRAGDLKRCVEMSQMFVDVGRRV